MMIDEVIIDLCEYSEDEIKEFLLFDDVFKYYEMGHEFDLQKITASDRFWYFKNNYDISRIYRKYLNFAEEYKKKLYVYSFSVHKDNVIISKAVLKNSIDIMSYDVPLKDIFEPEEDYDIARINEDVAYISAAIRLFIIIDFNNYIKEKENGRKEEDIE